MRAAFVLATGVILAPALMDPILLEIDPDLAYLLVQEDEVLEWTTFFAFALAGISWVGAARRRRSDGGALPWFALGLAAFCLFVALEEISWGQRILAYRPPAYFLANNAQQELNLHNVIDTDWRVFAFQAVLVGYGVILPLLMRIPVTASWLSRLGVHGPALGLVPAFAAMFALYLWYPWDYTAEFVEAMLGLGFLYAAQFDVLADVTTARTGRSPLLQTMVVAVAVAMLGAGAAQASRLQRGGDPGQVEATLRESLALRADLRRVPSRGVVATKCGQHMRLYKWVRKYADDLLESGSFAALMEQGLPEERARFFLDPWNSPYWVRHVCDPDRESAYVYSFGPNRIRDSLPHDIGGDDAGSHLIPSKRSLRPWH